MLPGAPATIPGSIQTGQVCTLTVSRAINTGFDPIGLHRTDRAPERFQIISGRGCARAHIRDLLPKRGAYLRLRTS